MTCENVQRRLLSLSSPGRPPEELLPHLADCPVCGHVQRRLAELERQVATIPVPPPPTGAVDRVIHRVLADPMLRASVRGRRPAFERRPWPKVLAAAMVLLALGGTFVAYVRTRTPPAGPGIPAADQLLAKVVQRNVSLAGSRDPARQVAVLAEMADDLHDGTRTLCKVADGDDLTRLAEMYRKVVRDGLLAQAHKRAQELETEAERQRALGPFAERLTQRSQEADRWAGEAPASSSQALQKMARTARESAHELRLLIRGQT
jgi:hypothetical protein